MWIEIPLIFLGGLLGSSHCIGMCGGFAMAVGSQANHCRANLIRQLVFTLGRLFTYATCGILAGFGGQHLRTQQTLMLNVAATLSIVAGLFLLYQGGVSAGLIPSVQTVWRRWPSRGTSAGRDPLPILNTASGCSAAGVFAAFLRAPGWRNVFLAGLFTGMLPCGLVYGFLALAASTTNPWSGGMLMLTFGAGTAPAMVLTGAGASLLKMTTRQRAFRFAAWCVLATGGISIYRGLGFLSLVSGEIAGCPLCR